MFFNKVSSLCLEMEVVLFSEYSVRIYLHVCFVLTSSTMHINLLLLCFCIACAHIQT